MAIQCIYCGTELPRDDARFCNNCGMLVPSHPLSPHSLAATKSNAHPSFSPSPVKQQESNKPALREQVAYLPPARPPRRPGHDTPSAQSDRREQKKSVSEPVPSERVEKAAAMQEGGLQEKLPETPQPEMQEQTFEAGRSVSREKGVAPVPPRPLPSVSRVREPIARDRTTKRAPEARQSPAWPPPITHVSVKEAAPSEKDAMPAQRATPAPASRQPSSPSVRDLHVKVWKPGEEGEHGDVEEQSDEGTTAIEDLPTRSMAATATDRSGPDEQAVETYPTSPLVPSRSEPSLAQDSRTKDGAGRPVSLSSPEQWNRRSAPVTPIVPGNSPTEREYQSATPLTRQAQEQPAVAAPASEYSDISIQEQTRQDAYIDRHQPEMVPRSSTPAPIPPLPGQVRRDASTVPSAQIAEDGMFAPVGHRSRRRFPLVFSAILLAVLVLGGIGVWIVTSQPFSVAPITQPQLSFSDTNLGIALSYPNGWIKQVESGKSTVHFYASNHTAGVDMSVADAGNGNVNQVLQQQATKLGMGGAKAGEPLTFAGATWQQLQGNLQQSGANYTGTVLATVHGNHLFTIVQLAPQGNYADWEKEFFAPMRSTLRFL